MLEKPADEDAVTVLRYIWRVVDDGADGVVRQRLLELAPTFGEAMSSYEERLIEKGREEGRQEGRQEGRGEAIRDVLVAQLRARFGTVDATVEARIHGASDDELGRWVRRVVLVERIEELFAE